MYKFFAEEQGTAAIEYALLISLLGMAIAGSLQALGGNVFDTLSKIGDVFLSVQYKDDLLKHKL
jgi:Flp pilus assembly pilin Flp